MVKIDAEKLQQYAQWVINEAPNHVANYDFVRDMDSSYRLRTPGDFWNMTTVPANGKPDFPEILNYALNHEWASDAMAEQIGFLPPWQLTSEQEVELQPTLNKIDVMIAKAKAYVAKLDNVTTDEARDEHLAVCLWAACLMSADETVGQVQEVLSRYNMLSWQDEARGDALALRKSPDDQAREGTVYDVLKMRDGSCTEKSYTFKFIGNRAGLDVGFAEAVLSLPGKVDHVLNLVYCGDAKEPLKVDVAQLTIEQEYANELPLDDYQMIGVYYANQRFRHPETHHISSENGLLFDPFQPSLLSDLGGEHDDLGDFGMAAAYHTEAIKYGPQLTNTWWNAAQFYATSPQYGDVEHAYQQAYNLVTDYDERFGRSRWNERAYAQYASICERLGKYDEAVQVYESFKGPEHLYGNGSDFSYAFSLAMLGRLADADRAFDRALQGDNDELAPGLSLYLDYANRFLPKAQQREAVARAVDLSRQAKAAEDHPTYEKIIRDFSDTSDDFTFSRRLAFRSATREESKLYNLFLDTRDESYGAAIAFYEEQKDFGSLQPFVERMYQGALYNAAVEHFNAKNFEEALPFVRKHYAMVPENAESQRILLVCLLKTGRNDEALALLDKVSEKNRAVGFSLIGEQHFKKNEFAQAAGYYQKASQLDPDKVSYLNNAAASFHNAGDSTQATKYQALACQLDKQSCQ